MAKDLKKTPTIKDVATHAGVSIGTVSRVLSKEPAVKAHLKEKVDAAVAALGYRPNFAARALRKNHIDVVGFVLPDITNPFFSQLAKSIESEASARNHTVMLACSYNDPAIEQTHIRALLDRSVRGIVVIAASDEAENSLEIDVPVISLDRQYAKYPLISTNHIQGAALVADHLVELGHRRFAYIAGPLNTEVGRARQVGFVQHLRQLTDDTDPADLIIRPGQFDYESGEKITLELLDVPEKARPTAIVAASDQQAIGALRAARDLGLNVPNDLSVTGFDDIVLAELVAPRLTTVRQPTSELAKRAIEAIFAKTAPDENITIDGKLIRRTSTGPAPN
ncbi:LacI family DNA-binding transcriptional regulator [Roseibium sp.]|uniref:LacI family DNA-binding transcriptional regulator n=1 Tax=Roseibium sp. TaxID=1936156 RepID=UPI003B51E560